MNPKSLGEAFAASVQNRLGGNPEHGWGQDDSLAVMEDVVAEDAKLAAAAKKPYTGLSAEAKSISRALFNPSAFLQSLTKFGLQKERTATRRGGVNAAQAALASIAKK